MARGDKTYAGIASRRAAAIYGGEILAENVHDNAENFTRFVLLVPPPLDKAAGKQKEWVAASSVLHELIAELATPEIGRSQSGLPMKVSLALRLAHKPGALLAALEPFAGHGVNLQKIESRPIHGRPFEYQFFLDVEANSPNALEAALAEVQKATSVLRVLGSYPSAARI